MRRLRLPLPLMLFLAVALSAAGGPREGEESVFVRTRYLMGTPVEVKARGEDAKATQAAINAAFDEIARIEALTTTWRADSAVSRLNAMAGKGPVEADPELIAIVARSLDVSRMTEGAFDITIEPVVRLWRIEEEGEPRVPREADIARALARVGYRHVKIDRQAGTISLDEPGVRIGLGGVAKGYAVERAARVLAGRGVRSAIVTAGGDMALIGRDGHRPWRVGVRDPRDAAATIGWMELEDATVHTSGDYERFRMIAGKLYHHILSPLTGYPATRSRAVTVVAREGALGDALSTGIFVLGPEEGMRLVEGLEGVEALVVDGAGKIHLSGAMRQRFHRAPRPAREAPPSAS